MSSILYQYTGYSFPISGPQIFVCSSPVKFTEVSLQDPELPRCNLVRVGVGGSGLGKMLE
jgi:hypothetical protein